MNRTITSVTAFGSPNALLAPFALMATMAAANAQSGSTEIPLPGDIPMSYAIQVELLSQEFPTETEVVSVLSHVDPSSGQRSSTLLFHGVDAAGQVALRQRLDTVRVLRSDSSALVGDRLVVRTDVPGERMLFERVGGMWRETGLFGELQTATSTNAQFGTAMSDERVALVNAERGTLDVYDLPPVGLPTLSARIALPVGKVALMSGLAFSGDRIVVFVRNPGPFVGGEELHVYELGSSGWVEAWSTDLALEFRPQTANGALVRASADRLAVAIMRADPSRHPCGVVLVYREDGAGGYVIEQRVEPNGACMLTANIGSTFGFDLAFDDDRMLVVDGYGETIHRVERGAQGWAETGRFAATYNFPIVAFAGDRVVSFSSYLATDLLLELFDVEGSAAGFQIVCPSPKSGTYLTPWSLILAGTRSMSAPTSAAAYSVPSSNQGLPNLLLIGRERSSRVLGPGSELCIGGAGFARVLGFEVPPFGGAPSTGPQGVYFNFSAADFAGAGDTLFFQAWRAEPGGGAGSTSNAIAITYVP